MGAAAALIAVLVFRRNLGSELSLLGSCGIISGVPASPPDSSAEWLALLQNSPPVGLTLLEVFDIVNYLLVGLLFLDLYGALQHVHRGWMVAEAASAAVGVGTYFSANQAFAMRSLSSGFLPPFLRRSASAGTYSRNYAAKQNRVLQWNKKRGKRRTAVDLGLCIQGGGVT
jgi:hypothetical protein